MDFDLFQNLWFGFSVAVTNTGDLYCTGDNGVGQCPIARGGRVEVFTKVPIPELAGTVDEVRAGAPLRLSS